MKFHDLEITNFLAITQAKFDLSDRGLVLIEGVNLADTSAKSNGAGKSSIADALCWVWFGTTARRETGDDIVNDITGKNCSVKSVIVDGGLTYTAVRYRKHKTGKDALTISVNDGFVTTELTKGTNALTQEIANQIIGSSLEVFAGSIYAGQERMPDLPAMTDKALKVLIEEAAGTTALEEAYKLAREQVRLADITITSSRTMEKLVHGKVQNAIDMIDNAGATEMVWEASQKLMMDKLVDELKTVDKPALAVLMDEINTLKALKLEDQIAVIDAKIDAVEAERIELARLIEVRNQHKFHLDNEIKNLATAEVRITRCTKAVAEIAHQVGCPCDACGRPLTEAEIKTAKAAAEAQLLAENVGHKDIQIRIEDYEKLLKSAAEEVERFSATLTDISAENASKGALTRSLGELNVKNTQSVAALKQMRDKVEKVKSLQTEVSPFKAQIEKLKLELKDHEAEVVSVVAGMKKHQNEIDLLGEVVKVFAPSGVRARILDDVTPFLNAQTSKYLSILSDGNIEAIWTTLTKNSKGEFKEKFSIDVRNFKGGKKFGLISGGEKRKVRIATALGLQDLVATRATKPIDIFIGDEIDDALDEAGLERLMIILEEKARERGSVFIISHNELRDYIRNVITIEKTATGETVVTESVS